MRRRISIVAGLTGCPGPWSTSPRGPLSILRYCSSKMRCRQGRAGQSNSALRVLGCRRRVSAALARQSKGAVFAARHMSAPPTAGYANSPPRLASDNREGYVHGSAWQALSPWHLEGLRSGFPHCPKARKPLQCI